MEDNQVENTRDFSERKKITCMHLAILPLDGKSVILAFYHKKDRNYKRLWHQFNSSSRDVCLQYLNYMIFAHTENYYFSKSIGNQIKDNKRLSELSREVNGIPLMGLLGGFNNYGRNYRKVKPSEIPNFLGKEWAI